MWHRVNQSLDLASDAAPDTNALERIVRLRARMYCHWKRRNNEKVPTGGLAGW
jgi:hypothetical protein